MPRLNRGEFIRMDRVTIKKWGDSVVLRLPPNVVLTLGLEPNQTEVDINVDRHGRMLVEKVEQKAAG